MLVLFSSLFSPLLLCRYTQTYSIYPSKKVSVLDRSCSAEHWSCCLLRPHRFHAAALRSNMAATLPSLCKSLSDTQTRVWGWGCAWDKEGWVFVKPPPHVPWQEKLQQPLNWALLWPFLLETLVDRIKGLSLRGEESYSVCFPSNPFSLADVIAFDMFKTRWRQTIFGLLALNPLSIPHLFQVS